MITEIALVRGNYSLSRASDRDRGSLWRRAEVTGGGEGGDGGEDLSSDKCNHQIRAMFSLWHGVKTTSLNSEYKQQQKMSELETIISQVTAPPG